MLMRKAFSLTEVMIVAAILGILAAVVMPALQGHITEAKEAAAKDTLRILRNAIEVYVAQHNDVAPGYPNDDAGQTPRRTEVISQMLIGHYINTMPENPFNGYWMLKIIGNEEQLPAEATGEFGWIYQPATKTIRLDWPGKDKMGVLYYDY